jgi:hypothetical protein
VSDIGIVFPWWFTLGAALMIALPVTTAIIVGLGVAASRARRLGHARRLAGVKWSMSIVAPFWLVGLSFGGWAVVSEIRRHIYDLRHYFTLAKAQEVDGIAFPAGTWVALDEDEALKEAELPAGATMTLRAAEWQGKLEFAAPAHAPNAAHGRITDGTLAASTAIDGIPCKAGDRATFFWGGQLMKCTLSRAADLSTTITTPDGAAQVRKLRCMAGDTIHMAGLRPAEVEGCRLAEPVDVDAVVCAERERILVINGELSACTFAEPARFGLLALPAGTAVTNYDRHPRTFRLPPRGASVDAFGLSLPAGTEGSFCYRKDALEHLSISNAAFVVIEGVKLTGWIDFDCGAFRNGQLFEDTVVGGRRRQHGERVSREDLPPQNGD